MPALFEFLLRVNIALLLFCAGYFLVLRHLTFYSLNRIYLVTAIIFATVYPKIDLTAFAQKHEHITLPVQSVLLHWEAPAQTSLKPIIHTNYWLWTTCAFWAGVALLGLRLAIQLFSLFKLYCNSQETSINNYRVRLIDGKVAPFSFWRSIFVNPANHSTTDLKAILQHEQIHVNEWHTIDILLAELSSIFYWFNPGVWLIKKAVRENIEFITDRKILNAGFDSKAYQYSLVNVSFTNTTPRIVNHFNISTIKKRIMMMNAKRSSRFTLTRYAFVIPAVMTLLLIFTLSKAELRKPMAARIESTLHPITAALIKATDHIMAKADTITIKKIAGKIKNAEGNTVTFTATNNITGSLTQNDTVKKDKTIITGTDLENFVVNGKKVAPADFKNINPDKIMAINIVSANDAKKMLLPADNLTFDNDKQIIFVTMKDSEIGKKLLERLGTKRQLTNLTLSMNGKPAMINGSDLVLHDNVNSRITLSNLYQTRNDSSKVFIINGLTSTIKADDLKQIVLDSDMVKVQGIQGAGIITYTARPDHIARIKINGKNLPDPLTVQGYDKPFYSLKYSNTGISRISDKLIIIDGKEATEKELKKISAFDIDRMEVQSSSDTIKKYGKKAKYVIVYIYTKKGGF